MGPTSSVAADPAGTTSSGPLSVKLRTDTPVPARAVDALGTSSGATVGLPALSRTVTVKA